MLGKTTATKFYVNCTEFQANDWNLYDKKPNVGHLKAIYRMPTVNKN